MWLDAYLQAQAQYYGTTGCSGTRGNPGSDGRAGSTYNLMTAQLTYSNDSAPTFLLSGQSGQQGGTGREPPDLTSSKYLEGLLAQASDNEY